MHVNIVGAIYIFWPSCFLQDIAFSGLSMPMYPARDPPAAWEWEVHKRAEVTDEPGP